jgi:transposase
MVDSQMHLSAGLAVMAMVLDTLSGRTPLYRLKDAFAENDTELLLGTRVDPERLCDYNLARVLDRIYEAGTQKIFTQLAQNAIGGFSIDTRRLLHYDTTSISVYGDYEMTEPFNITYGHSNVC